MKILELKVHTLALELKHPFSISHGTSTKRQSVIIEILSEDLVGYGEAAVVPYYRETEKSIVESLSRARHSLIGAQIDDLDSLKTALHGTQMDNIAARSALDIGLWDLFAKANKTAIWQLLEGNPRSPESSITVALEPDLGKYRRQLGAMRNWPILKLKLGSGSLDHDLELVDAAKATVGCALCVDVNGGWAVDEAVSAISRISDKRIIYIEQPVKPEISNWRQLRKRLPGPAPPLIADESFQQISDIPKLTGLVDGVNIKLRKVGGVSAASQCIEVARKAKMKILMGCMIESSVAISAAASLASQADFVDLDGPLLIANDPFTGVIIKRGKLNFPNRYGHGAVPC